jgi:8-oxo-dGTP diphosphatase
MKLLLWLWGVLPMPNWLRWATLWVVNQKFLVGVSAVVVNEQGEILMFKHTYRGKHPWGLPGGWLMGQEDPARAIEREIYEESGFRVRALFPLRAACTKRYPQLDLIYLARLESGTFRPSAEVSEFNFFSPEDFCYYAPDAGLLILDALAQDARVRAIG